MWVVMMVSMMLPSLVPMLWRYRQAVGRTGETPLGRLTALVGVGYFFVWTVFGMTAFPLGVALAAIEMQQPALARGVPIAAGVVVLIAGSLQFTAWKARHLCLLPGGARARPCAAGRRRHGLATRPAPRPPLQPLLLAAPGLRLHVRARVHGRVSACSGIADGFDGFVVHLANHDVTLCAVSRAPLAKQSLWHVWRDPGAAAGAKLEPDFDHLIAGKLIEQLPWGQRGRAGSKVCA
jgi:hypothetical protein